MRNIILAIILLFTSLSCFADNQSGELSLISVSADGNTETVVLKSVKKLMFTKSEDKTQILAYSRSGNIETNGTRKIYFRKIETPVIPTDTIIPPTDTIPTDTIVPPADTIIPPIDTIIPPIDTIIPPIDTIVPPIDTIVPPADTIVPPIDTIVPPADTIVPPIDTIIPPVDTVVPPIDPVIPPKDPIINPDKPDNGDEDNPWKPDVPQYKGNSIVIFPNPVSNYLTVGGISEEDEIQVYDIQGKIYIRTKGSNIDVSSLTQGSYMLRVKDCDMVFIKK